MLHCHLTHQDYSLAAIDNVIARGKKQDWADLRKAAIADQEIMVKILKICLANTADPYAQRYFFWKQYAEKHLA